MTSRYGRAVQEELRPQSRALRSAIPDVYRGFAALHDCALVAGALESRTKVLIALAIAVSKECDGCIAAYAHAAARHGASAQEVAETIGVTFLMNGGPATIYGPRAYSAFLEFAEHEQGPSALPSLAHRHVASE